MNSTNPHDTDRDILALAWYASLPPKKKRRVDRWVNEIYLVQKVNPQCGFSQRMALEIAFMFVMFSVYGPMNERMQ